jgi:hypothetical protein
MHRRRPLGVIGFRRRRSFRKLIDDERREGVEFLAILWHSANWHCDCVSVRNRLALAKAMLQKAKELDLHQVGAEWN